MKKVYIKPVCETESVLNIMPIAASGVHGNDAGSDIGYGGVGDGNADVKADNFWGDEEW